MELDEKKANALKAKGVDLLEMAQMFSGAYPKKPAAARHKNENLSKAIGLPADELMKIDKKVFKLYGESIGRSHFCEMFVKALGEAKTEAEKEAMVSSIFTLSELKGRLERVLKQIAMGMAKEGGVGVLEFSQGKKGKGCSCRQISEEGEDGEEFEVGSNHDGIYI